jgi:isoleucyl-tRNA synthetase
MPAVKKALAAADGGKLLAELKQQGQVALDVNGKPVVLDDQDIEVRLQAKEGWTAAQGPHVVVVLAIDLTPELTREGFAQDLKRLVQEHRKEIECQYTDRIRIGLPTDNDELWLAVEENLEFLKHETLATAIVRDSLDGVEPMQCDVADSNVTIYVQVLGT